MKFKQIHERNFARQLLLELDEHFGDQPREVTPRSKILASSATCSTPRVRAQAAAITCSNPHCPGPVR